MTLTTSGSFVIEWRAVEKEFRECWSRLPNAWSWRHVSNVDHTYDGTKRGSSPLRYPSMPLPFSVPLQLKPHSSAYSASHDSTLRRCIRDLQTYTAMLSSAWVLCSRCCWIGVVELDYGSSLPYKAPSSQHSHPGCTAS